MNDEMVEVFGRTYPIRKELKDLGGVYDPKLKIWRVPKSKKILADYYVANPPRNDEEEVSSWEVQDIFER